MNKDPKLRSQADQKRQNEFYSKLIRDHGNQVQSLNWGSRQSQNLRFEIFLEMPVHWENARILDIGSGFGDFLEFLKNKKIDCDYLGIDLVSEMIDQARKNHPNEKFEVRDFLENKFDEKSFDIVVASGIFYARQFEPEKFFEQALKEMFRICRKAVAVNSLSSRGRPSVKGEFHLTPEQAAQMASSITSKFSLRHDYYPGDLSLYLFRAEQP